MRRTSRRRASKWARLVSRKRTSSALRRTSGFSLCRSSSARSNAALAAFITSLAPFRCARADAAVESQSSTASSRVSFAARCSPSIRFTNAFSATVTAVIPLRSSISFPIARGSDASTDTPLFATRECSRMSCTRATAAAPSLSFAALAASLLARTSCAAFTALRATIVASMLFAVVFRVSRRLAASSVARAAASSARALSSSRFASTPPRRSCRASASARATSRALFATSCSARAWFRSSRSAGPPASASRRTTRAILADSRSASPAALASSASAIHPGADAPTTTPSLSSG